MSFAITAVLILYVLLMGFLTAFPARKHYWVMALIRTGIIAVSAVISVPVSKAIAGALSGSLSSVFDGLFSGEIGELVEHAPILKDSVSLMVTLMIAPIIFLFLFLILRGILGIAALIVEKTVPYFKERHPKKGDKKDPNNTAIAVPVGAFNGVLFALITLIPLCGYVGLISSFMGLADLGESDPADDNGAYVAGVPSVDYLSDMGIYDPNEDGNYKSEDDGIYKPDEDGNYKSDDEGRYDANEDEEDGMMATFQEILDNPMIGAVNVVGNPLFDWMTTGKVEGSTGDVKFSLKNDLSHLVESLDGFVKAIELTEDGDMTAEDQQAMMDAVDFLMESDWVAEVMAQTLGYMANQWQNGQSALGIDAPSVDGALKPVMDKMWEILATENKETIREDLRTLTVVLGDLMSLGNAGVDGDQQAMLDKLGGENSVFTHMMQTLDGNEHMKPLADELRAASLRLVSQAMGDALKNTDQYDGVISNVATVLNDVANMPAEERKETLRTEVKRAFAEQDIDVPEDVAVELSEKAIADLTADGQEITEESLKNYFIENMDESLDAVGGAVDGDLTDALPEGSIPGLN